MSDFTLTPDARVVLVAAAATTAGPKASDVAIEQQMGRLIRLASGKAMARVERILGEGTFPAVILSVDLEESSKRGILKLRTEPSKRYPDGIEPIRTDPMWAGGRPLYELAKALRGHKVIVHKAMEAKSDGTDEKVRILVGLTDLGMDGAQPTDAQPASAPQEPSGWSEPYDPTPQPATPAAVARQEPAAPPTPKLPPLRQEPPGEDWGAPWGGAPSHRHPANQMQDMQTSAFTAEKRAAASAVDNGLPAVKLPAGQLPGVAPTVTQLRGISQLLLKLYEGDEVAGRCEVYRLLNMTVPPSGPTLKAIPTYYEAAQIAKHLAHEINARLAKRSA